MELGFFKMFIWFLPQKSLRRPYIRARFRNGKLEIYGRRRETVPNLLQKVKRCKNEIRKICIGLLDDLQSSQYCKFSDSNELLQFMNCTLRNLEILVRKESGSVVYVRMQIRSLIKKLRVLRDFVKSTEKDLCFSINVEEWAQKVACVSMLYWVEEEEDRLEEAMLVRMKDILSNLLEMVESYTPEVVGIYVRVLKVSVFSPSDAFQIGEVVSSFVDFLLQFGFMKILREELIFLITFLMNPYPIEREVRKEDWDLMGIKAEAVAREVPSLVCALTSTEMNQETQERNILISDFQEKTDKVKSQVRKLLHFQIPLHSLLIPLGDSQFPFDDGSTYSFFFRLRFLRVLDLGTVSFGYHFPEPILLLICLRYLCINFITEAVPLSIGNLRNLETFHVIRSKRKEAILRLPHTIWNMKSLRNINVGRGSITLLDDNASNVCPQLGNLHCFSSLCLSNVEDAEQILRGFPSVRKLKLEISKSWDCKGNCDRFPVLHSLIKLESLNLKYSEYVAHSCALNFPTTLKKLTLSMFYGSWSEISTIGKLPNLEVFKLGFTSLGATWVVEDDEFLNLKYLKLTRLAISRWEVSTSSFPCLERLVVESCHFLVEFPSRFEDVLTLKTIQVFWCSESLSTSAESIRYEQRDLGNEDLEVLISNEIIHYDRLQQTEKLILVRSLLDKQRMPNYQIEHALELFGFDEKKDIDSKKIYDQTTGRTITKKESARRMNLILKHNCQPRQAVMSRHNKQELKRDI